MGKISKLGKSRSGQYRSNWSSSYRRDVKILGGRCEFCGSTHKLQRHHGLHKSKHGGPDNLINLVLVCAKCHEILHSND